MRPEEIDALTEDKQDEPYLFLTLESSAVSVRAALGTVRTALRRQALDTEIHWSVEQVLAEVMNNICEHAYRASQDGRIDLLVWVRPDELKFETRDNGEPMPGGSLPIDRPISLDCPIDDLPEGGFGWHMIHALTADLVYARIGKTNHLSFRMPRNIRPTTS